MTEEALAQLEDYLADPTITQRDKLAMLSERLIEPIRALHDDDYERVVRAIKKQVNSKKLDAKLAVLLAALAERAPHPRFGGALPPPVAPRVPPSPESDDQLAQLEAAIAANPDLPDNYLVYGDLLEARGDPHRAQVAHETKRLAGPLAGCADLVTEIDWYRGFIRKCRVAQTHQRHDRERKNLDLVEVMRWLVDDPGPGRFVQDLTVGIVSLDANSYERIAAVLAAKPRPTLRTLFLGDFVSEETELNWSEIGDISSLWPMVPALRRLILRSGTMTLGAIDLPKLERLETITGGMSADSARHIAQASWPSLVELSLQYGPESTATLADVEPLLHGARLPKLRHLGITNFGATDELCELLPRCEILPQLAVLDLSMGTLSDAGAATLQRHAPAFAHLERLVVDDNYLTAAGRALLAGLAADVAFGDQRSDGGDPGNRYASAYE